MFCQVCSSTLKAGDLFCSACGAVVPDHPPKPPASEAHDRIAGERKYLTVLCADLQRSTDLISGLDPEEAISRLEPAMIAMRTAVRRNRGIVSKEGGDGLIALFGATSPRSMRRADRRYIWSSGSRAQPRPDKSWCRNPVRLCPLDL